MTKTLLTAAAVLLLTACGQSEGPSTAPTPSAQSGTPAAAEEAQGGTATPSAMDAANTVQTETHVFEEIGPGVYFATGTGLVNVASNALVVVNEEDVLVVDSHITGDAGRELVRSIGTLTDKPIRYLVNSHFHFDHAHGNQSFPDGTDIIGHEYTRERLSADPLSEATYQTIGSPAAQSQMIAALEGQISGTNDPEARSALEAQKTMLERHIAALDEVTPTPPNVTFEDTLTMYAGTREIQLIHPGRGHTGGDVIVYLPAERIVFTGDLLYAGAPYLGDGFADEFPDTLERVKALDVDIIAGGHGPLMRDKSGIDRAQAYLRMYWDQVSKAYAEGKSVADAVASLDMTGYEDFAVFQLASPAVQALEVGRMYERLEALE
jgi:glyoxylase-like metal-dependent hydrolase (beta-lactamase superfamily II)